MCVVSCQAEGDCEGVRCLCARVGGWWMLFKHNSCKCMVHPVASVCVAFAFSRVGRPAPGLGLLRDFFTVVYLFVITTIAHIQDDDARCEIYRVCSELWALAPQSPATRPAPHSATAWTLVCAARPPRGWTR